MTCLAGAGTLLPEFGVLSRLTNDPKYEVLSNYLSCSFDDIDLHLNGQQAASRALKSLWERREPATNLLGGLIDVNDVIE